MTRKTQLEEQLTGKWAGVLAQCGINEEFLTGKQGPCPVCGGKDRFRFTDYQGRGESFCNKCESCDGWDLLMRVHGWNFRQTLEAVAQAVDFVEYTPRKRKHRRDPRSSLRRLLEGCSRNREPLRQYLSDRGLTCMPPALRFHPRLPYFHDDGNVLGEYPAMLGVVQNADGSHQSVHRTWFEVTLPKRKKIMPPVTKLRSAAVRLMPATDCLAIAEGIETAIAVHEMSDMPAWAVLGTTMMTQFEPPEGVRCVHVYADNDESYAGQSAAFRCAERLSQRGLRVEVIVPPDVGTDWLDHWLFKKEGI